MKKVQRFMGVGDSKPASAPLSTSPGNSYLSAGIIANQYASTPSTPGVTTSINHDSTTSRLFPPPSQSTSAQQPSSQQARFGSRQVSPQSSQAILRSALASPQPTSASAQQQYFDLPVRAVSPSAAASPRPVSPLVQPILSNSVPVSSALTPGASTSDVHLVERPELHKSLKALESLLVNLDEYRDLSARLAKVEKKLAKSTSELERTKVVLDTPSQTLQLASTMFEGLAEVSSRHAKHVQREYEAVNDACAKYFKKVAKEERAHDELVQALDTKIKKANAAHEKNVKKATPNKALESHDKYIATVQALTNDIACAKNAHAHSMAAKSHASSLLVASTVGGLADVEFKRSCESVRRVGPHVGRLNELLCFASSEFMPALQASELQEAEQGQAEYLASLSAQVEASLAAQAQANAKINEDTQTILRAQEMGWRPPSPLAPPAANLGRSNSINSNSSRVTDAAGSSRSLIQNLGSNSNGTDNGSGTSSSNLAATAPRSTSLQLQPQPEGSRSRSNSSAKVDSASNAPVDNDAASVRSIATDQTPRPANGTASQSSALLSAPNTGSGLVRASTGSTIKSMAAQPQTWEGSTASSNSSAVGASATQSEQIKGRFSSSSLVHDRDRTDSSAQEGSIVDKLAVPREGSDNAPPSLSASNSAQGSEDGNRIPRTPDDSEATPLMQSGPKPLFQQPLRQFSKDSAMLDYRDGQPVSNSAETDRSRAVTSPIMRPAQRALEQYREQTARAETSPTTSRFDRDSITVNNGGAHITERSDSLYGATSQPNGGGDEVNARKISLWERERERMRQLEREEELTAMRAPGSAAAELSYQRPQSAFYTSNNPSSTFMDNGRWSRSKISDEGISDKNGGSQLGLGYPRSSGPEPHDLDRYAPAVGSTRLSATGVTRSLSTDTTASERSFVARMKARYQAEKDLEREQRELNVLEKERAARKRATMDPALSLPSMSGVRARVPEIASRYQPAGAPTYAQEVNPGRRYHDSLPANAAMGGMGSRVSAKSSTLSASVGNGSVDEFGNIVRDSRIVTTGRRSMEPPHSDVCGCHQCSARHYGSGATRMDQTGREEEIAASANARGNPREFNVRHTSMPAVPRQQQQYGKQQQQQHMYTSSPPRDAYVYREQQLLPPAGRGAAAPRRSYEDLDGGSRRVAFVHEPQTIR